MSAATYQEELAEDWPPFLPDALLADTVQELFHLYLVNAEHNCCRFLFETILTLAAFPSGPTAGHCPGARAALLRRCHKQAYKGNDNVDWLLSALQYKDTSSVYQVARGVVKDHPAQDFFPAAEAYIRSAAANADLIPAPAPVYRAKKRTS